MRHLQVLAAAGLVTSRKRGRERWHYLNAIPLQQMYERWVGSQAAAWASSLLRLQESAQRRMTMDKPAVDIALRVQMAAPPSTVFAALTEDPGGWWGPPYLRSDATALNMERRLGGHLVEVWEGGGGLLATITTWTQDRRLELTGPFHLGLALGIASFELSPGAEGGTEVGFSFRAVGAIEDEVVEGFTKGWGELVGQRLKLLVETGRRLGIAPDPPIQGE
jgi:uncharacterized protein YndB with AHSA1/START domain